MTKLLRVFLLSAAISIIPSANLWANYGDFLKGLASPRGAAIVGIVYGGSSAISNFLWAFDWEKHAGASAATKSRIQEAGGISAAAENLILGVAISVMLYQYAKHNSGNIELNKI